MRKAALLTFAVMITMSIAATITGGALAVGQDELPETIGTIERHDAEFDKLVPKGAKIEVLGGGFAWSEGPVWVPDEKSKGGGYLLFSDIPNNCINRWREGEGVTSFLKRSGYTGKQKFTGPEPGTNGLTLDAQGRLVMCCHGDRCVRRLEKDGTRTTLVAKYNGKRLNSPNDLIFHSSGDLYFTDPPYGLPKRFDDPARELAFCGVYRLSPGGKLTLLTKEMDRPNGIAFSPDERTLYVAQSYPQAPIWKAFPVNDDGTLGKGELFFDATQWTKKGPGLPDGMAVDEHGNVWGTAAGGIMVVSPQGKLLGRIVTGEKTANCTFGGPDGKTLFITADMYLCRVPTNVRGLTAK